MALLPTYDYESEQAQLDRKQKLVDAMMTGGLAPLDTNLGQGVRQSPLAAVAKILQVYLAGKQGDALGTQRQELHSRYQEDLTKGLAAFRAGSQAQVGDGTAVTDESGGHTGDPMSAQDAQRSRMDAVYNAIAANHPVLRGLGSAALGQMQKDQITTKDVVGQADPAAIPDMARLGIAGFRPKPEFHNVNEGQQLVKTVPGKADANVAFDGREKFSDPTQIEVPGGLPQTVSYGKDTNKPVYAPAVQANPNLTGEQQAAKTGVESAFSTVSDSYKTAKDLPGKAQRLESAAQLIQAGMQTGSAAEYKVALAKAWKAISGQEADPATLNSEDFASKMAGFANAMVKDLKPTSDSDRKAAEEAAGKKLSLEPQTLLRIINASRADAYNAMIEHQRTVRRAYETPGVKAGHFSAMTPGMHFAVPDQDQNFDVDFSRQGDVFHAAGASIKLSNGGTAPTVSNWPGK